MAINGIKVKRGDKVYYLMDKSFWTVHSFDSYWIELNPPTKAHYTNVTIRMSWSEFYRDFRILNDMGKAIYV